MAEESIYNLIPQPVPVPEQPPRYYSKHPGNAQPTWSTFGMNGTSKPGYQNVAGQAAGTVGGHHEYKKPYASMGKLNNAISPAEVLKKGTGGGGGAYDASLAVQTGAFQYTDRRMPVLPSKEEIAIATMAVKESKKTSQGKNFITSNAVENILAVPKAPVAATNWLKKPHFGEVPPYLMKIKQEISDEYEYIKTQQQMMQGEEALPPGVRILSDEEKASMITALKVKWDDVNKFYQGSSVLSLQSLDTIGKVKRKEQYEAQLAQIEKDIEKLSKQKVYVQQD